MKKLLLLMLVVAPITILFAQQTVIQDANAQKRSVGSFHGISVSNSIDLYLIQGEEAVAVSASDAREINHLITEVRDGILIIRFERQNGDWWNMGNRKYK